MMGQDDIKYVLGLLNDALSSKDWDPIEEAKEALKECLDDDETTDED